MTSPALSRIAPTIGQIALAGLFGWLFHLAGIPAAWLSGAVIGAIAWGLTGSHARLPRPLVDAAMVLAGVVMGAGITPEALAAVVAYPVSIGLLVAAIVVVTFACAQFLMRVHGWRRDDAILASLPGALTAVLAVSVSRNADVTRIAVVQSFRLLILIAVLPFIVSFFGDGDSRALVGADQVVAGPGAFAAMVAVALGTALLFERLQDRGALPARSLHRQCASACHRNHPRRGATRNCHGGLRDHRHLHRRAVHDTGPDLVSRPPRGSDRGLRHRAGSVCGPSHCWSRG